jgi:hypothetical protein
VGEGSPEKNEEKHEARGAEEDIVQEVKEDAALLLQLQYQQLLLAGKIHWLTQ